MAGEVVTCGVLRPEVMLRQAQAQIEELREANQGLAIEVAQVRQRVDNATRTFAALVVQCGGEVVIDRAEWEKPYTLTRSEDPATHDVTWTAVRPPVVLQAAPAREQ